MNVVLLSCLVEIDRADLIVIRGRRNEQAGKSFRTSKKLWFVMPAHLTVIILLSALCGQWICTMCNAHSESLGL